MALKRCRWLIGSLLLVAIVAEAQNERLARADRLFAQRADLQHVHQTIALLNEILDERPDDYAALWRLARAYHFLGKHLTVKRERVITFKRGIEAGRRAVQLKPDRPEGHFWLAANYGEYGQQKSIFTRWRLVKPMRRELEAVIRLDPRFENGSAYAVLGKLDAEVPGLFGGNLNRGIRSLQRALQIGPNNSLAELFLAESYLKAGRRQEARRLLESILTQAPDPGYEVEYLDNRRRARELLDKHFRAHRKRRT